jgi:hypothetical protein
MWNRVPIIGDPAQPGERSRVDRANGSSMRDRFGGATP